MNSELNEKVSADDSILKKIFRGIALVGFGIVGTLFVFVNGMLGRFGEPKKKK
ncbi:MAG: hypothetical protein IK062_01490 [Selenomonadaceae bacterium]|nr:hypothetical protein [Selenomonadaceae bacterium]